MKTLKIICLCIMICVALCNTETTLKIKRVRKKSSTSGMGNRYYIIPLCSANVNYEYIIVFGGEYKWQTQDKI